jgi:hypothetical protein
MRRLGAAWINGGHPNVEQQQYNADMLGTFIKSTLGWQ